MPLRLDAGAADFEAALGALLLAKRERGADVDAAVAKIIADVRARGDKALVELTRRYDRVELATGGPMTMRQRPLRLPATWLDDVESQCEADALEALAFAAERITAYHRRQMPQDLDYVDAAGVRLGARWRALDSVGVYVPGGTAAYPSTVLMNVLPAKVAGVPRIAMVVPPGGCHPLVLAAAKLAGVDEIYGIGGAQAVAALAFGTESIRPVDKIVGPGNAYVAAAKRRVFGAVGIDMIAGPSEVLVVADRANDPAWIAADLMAQAEHDEAAQSILMTDDADFGTRVTEAVESTLAELPRKAIAAESWRRHGAIILVPDLHEVAALVDRLAPEHLQLAIEHPDALALKVRHAGAIFLGRYTPEAIGDYVGGPNHVLPTSGSARFSSGLGALDFLKRTSLLSCDAASLAALGPAAMTLARAEGLDAHALSIAIRLNLPRG